jgi:gas vesicle protein
MGEDPRAIRSDIEQTRAEMSDTVEAIGYKADVKSRAKDKVTETRDRVTDAAGRLTGRAADATPDTDQVKGQARRAKGIAQENPLGLAVGSIAMGFLAGLLAPRTRVEDEKLGQVGDQVRQTGREALDHGKEVAQEAASSAADTAREAGREHGEQLRDSATSKK